MSTGIITNKMFITARWFVDVFRNTINNEGWDVFHTNEPVNSCSVVIQSLDEEKCTTSEAYKLAEEYGWVLDNDGKCVDFNIEKITRNIHIITASELGLL